jgi:hypothetical protein
MGRFPSSVTYEAVELEPVAGERRFQFRGPGLDPEHLGVIISDADEALLVVSLLERAHAAGVAEGAASTLEAVYAALRPLAPEAPPAEEPTRPDASCSPFAFIHGAVAINTDGGDDAP